jgi:poly(A) polymerase
MRDVKKRVLRMIGDPATRYREDPVRIIRAVRFAAKLSGLGFTLEAKTATPIKTMKALLADVPQSRLFDEMLKLLQTGHALATIAMLKQMGLEKGIYPLLDVIVATADQPFLQLALQDTDRRVGEGKPVAPSFLLSCVLWPDVRQGWDKRLNKGEHVMPALHDAVDAAFDSRIGDVSGRGKLGTDMREIWVMQPRFEKRVGNAPFSLIEQPRFRASFDFLRLRAQTGEVELALAEWWEKFSLASEAERHDMVEELRQAQSARPARSRVRSKPQSDQTAEAGDAVASASDQGPESDTEATGTGEPRKRRRRRKPRGGAESQSTGGSD